MSTPTVLLVVPPFRSVLLPALGPALLKASLLEHGVSCEMLYLNLQFADRIGAFRFTRIEPQVLLSAGEFVFSCDRFAKTREDIESYVFEILIPSGEGRVLSRLLPPRKIVCALQDLVREARDFCDHAAEMIAARKPRLVGFSSCVQETMAALCIASRLKQLDPSIRTVLGGPNTQAEMGRELLEQFRELDYVAQGECEHSLVELAREIGGQRAASPIPGILRRELADTGTSTPWLTASQLEAVPPPDFGDYFYQWRLLRHPEDISPGLIVETSRGCWWGAIKSCPFCGVPGENWAFRAKSPDRALREIKGLVDRTGMRDVWFADLMVDLRTPTNLLSRLAEAPIARIFCETPGGMSRENVELLARAGVVHIQPGIESLGQHSLKLLNKPTTTVRNLQTLKWCGEVGIRTYWNYLCGLPGERDEDLDGVENLIELIHHFQPPSEAHLVRVQRFSEYFDRAAEFGFSKCRPASFYRHIYPFSEGVIQRLAYHFEAELIAGRRESAGFRRLNRNIQRWRQQFRRSSLEVFAGRNGDWVIDTRPCARRRVRRLSRLESDILSACDRGRDLRSLISSLRPGTDEKTARDALAILVRDRLVVDVRGDFVSLVMRLRTNGSDRGHFGGQPRRPTVSEAVRILRSLHVSPIDLGRFMYRSLPCFLRALKARLMALWWRTMARLVKLLLETRRGSRGER